MVIIILYFGGDEIAKMVRARETSIDISNSFNLKRKYLVDRVQ